MSQIKKRIKMCCKLCKSEFEAKRKDTLFCSKSCKNSQWFIDNKEHKDAYDKKRRAKNPEIFVHYTKVFRKLNPKKRYEYDKKMLEKPSRMYYYKIMNSIRRCFLQDRKGNKSKILGFLNYSMSELKNHLISTFPDGRTWNDYISGKLQLDHIKPHSLFTYSHHYDNEFKDCWSLSNLRLLTKKENHLKNKSYEY